MYAGGADGLTEQYHPLITPMHSSLHPLLSFLSPSSHVSEPNKRPSPHIGSHVLYVIKKLFVQVHPVSIWQVEDQPSPSEGVPSFSHCSLIVMKPSPHCSTQVSG